MEVSSGDLVQIPVSIVNSSTENLNVKLSHSLKSSLLVPYENEFFDGEPLKLPGGTKKRLILDLDVNNGFETSEITLSGDAGPLHDKVTRKLNVIPSGFPSTFSIGGVVSSKDQISMIVPIPENVVKSSLKSTLKFYPSPVSNIAGALESLLKIPHGCFEQVSSTTYPTVMAHQYFISHQHLINVGTMQKSYNLIENGYKKLISYECKEGGFEWFGNGSAHEGLT
jgi:alpha-2-macroglobulin-like protein